MSFNYQEEALEARLDFGKRGGLLPVIVQEYRSNEVLMLAYANKQALEETLSSGYATFWSTSRNELWTKGKTSGDLLAIKEIKVDCDQDALLYRVEALGGGACHTRGISGALRRTCFYRSMTNATELSFEKVEIGRGKP